MTKKIMKKAFILFVLIVIAMLVINVNEALAFSFSSEITNLDAGANSGTGADKSIGNVVAVIISVVRVVGVGVAIIMLTVVAMKYLMAAPGDKAEIKKHAVVYVVGAVALFGMSGILTIIGDFAGII